MTSLKFCSSFYGATGVTSLKFCSSFYGATGGTSLKFVLVFMERLEWPRFFLVFYEVCSFTPFIAFLLFFFFFFRPMLKLPRWVYLMPFIALSLDGVFRGCFARVFTFLLVLLLFICFISYACSESLVSAHPSFLPFSLLFSVSVSQQAF